MLTLRDGGEVALDWFAGGCDENSPIIVILPGLSGASQAEYIKCLVLAANHCGIRTVVFNNRGLGGLELKTPRLYCAANCDDLVEVVNHVRQKYPSVKLGATGISMGGLVLANYIITQPEEARQYLTAAKIISVPWNTHKASQSMEKLGLTYLLGRHLAGNLCGTLRNCHIMRDTDIDIDHVLKNVSFFFYYIRRNFNESSFQARTIREFDNMFTCKHFGYEDAYDYYSNATIHNRLHKISVPLLSLSAADDPFQPLDGEFFGGLFFFCNFEDQLMISRKELPLRNDYRQEVLRDCE